MARSRLIREDGRGRSSMVERQLPKLHTRVRFPSPAPVLQACPGLSPIFPDRSRVGFSRRKTMALNLGADCGQTRGQYPAPPPEQPLSLKISFRQNDWPGEIDFAERQ